MANTGAYLSFAHQIDPDRVSVIVELGSRDGDDAVSLRDHFAAELVVAFDCNPQAVVACSSRLAGEHGIEFVPLAVWDANTEISFYPVTNGNTGASSAFKANRAYPYEYYVQSEVTVDAVRLDDWWHENHPELKIDMMCLDLQGAEVMALRGAGDLLRDTRYLITECQFKQLYHGTPYIEDIESLLREYGFVRVDVKPVNGWFGDALFERI